MRKISACVYTYTVLNNGDITELIEMGYEKAMKNPQMNQYINGINSGKYVNEAVGE